jgi:microsomal dipeptidase-like Zn-dependent dipeptidase
MIADLHCHYPMRLLAKNHPEVAGKPPKATLKRMIQARSRPRWLEKLRVAVLAVAARVLNYPRFWGTWRVDLDKLEQGNVRIVLSVLYQPFDEMDLDEPYAALPEPIYYEDLTKQLKWVEDDLGDLDRDRKRHVIVRTKDDLEKLGDRIGFLHCVEGGFHLGGTVKEVEDHVADLAEKGVFYITLAHLFWRQIATNEPALPFLRDWLYRRLFWQPPGAGLSKLGDAAVRAMYRHSVVIDLSHMREDAIDHTFALLEELDGNRDPKEFPVIASHSAFRCGRQTYNLSPQNVKRIAARGGVIGLILAQHQLNDGIRRRKTKKIEQTIDVLDKHITKIAEHAGSYDCIGIGSDLDGFIKPTTGGIENASDLQKLIKPFNERYDGKGSAMLYGNARGLVETVLARRAAGPVG